MNVIEARDLRKTYRRGGPFGARRTVHAVDGASLAVREGTCLALVGPSGSGKSTLGRMILGLEAPDGGEVLHRGRPLAGLRGEERRRARRGVQAVFQNSQGAVNPRFTAREIVAEPLVNFLRLGKEAARERVALLLAEVGLDPDDMEKRPHQFSGGELQRICLARALAPGPELIVLDEAVSSLDMLNQSRILDLLDRIRRERGTAYLLITHDMRVVARCADALAVMEEGRVTLRVDDLDAFSAADAAGTPLYHELMEAVLPARGEWNL